MVDNGRRTGTVKFFDAGKGFGFIRPHGGGKDVFVHAKQIADSGLEGLAEKEVVTFETQQGRAGKPQAHSLQIVSGDPA